MEGKLYIFTPYVSIQFTDLIKEKSKTWRERQRWKYFTWSPVEEEVTILHLGSVLKKTVRHTEIMFIFPQSRCLWLCFDAETTSLKWNMCEQQQFVCEESVKFEKAFWKWKNSLIGKTKNGQKSAWNLKGNFRKTVRNIKTLNHLKMAKCLGICLNVEVVRGQRAQTFCWILRDSEEVQCISMELKFAEKLKYIYFKITKQYSRTL